MNQLDIIYNFLKMEGYWLYVWSSFSISIVLITTLVLESLYKLKTKKKLLKTLNVKKELL